MYLEHFGLRESPFRITPHTEFFFTGANRGPTLEALIYAITHDEGIVKVSGEVGSGKTMLCRMLLQRLPANVDKVYLANPSLSKDEILHAIAEDLQVHLPEGRLHVLTRALEDRLGEIFSSGRRVVVLIDEAHAMPPESLEEIRLLSNLETNRHKLLRIVLFGQPELDERLADPSMRQLRERITHNFALEPLRRPDVGTYIAFRLRAAGYQDNDLFTPGAIQLIANASEGLTRRINILADKALLSAFSENKRQIDRKQVKEAIRDAQFMPMRDVNTRSNTWVLGTIAAISVGALIFLAGNHGLPSPQAALPPQKALPAAAANPPETIPKTPLAQPHFEQKQESDLGAPPSSASGINLDERISATEEWLRNAPDSLHFIQLLRTESDDRALVERFLESGTTGLDPAQVRVYRSRLSGKNRYGVIYGEFPTLEAAQAELARLPKSSKTRGVYIRTVSKLR